MGRLKTVVAHLLDWAAVSVIAVLVVVALGAVPALLFLAVAIPAVIAGWAWIAIDSGIWLQLLVGVPILFLIWLGCWCFDRASAVLDRYNVWDGGGH